MNPNEPFLVTVEKAAELTSFSQAYLRKQIAKGNLPVVRRGRAVRIEVQTLKSWALETAA